jgi:chorismate mutase/prephenate dehydratase
MTPPEIPKDISGLRQGIDDIDNQIVSLLRERARIARKVGEFKKDRGLPFHVISREQEIFDRLERADIHPFPRTVLKHIFREILSACLALEEPLVVAYLGPPASYTHQASLKYFGSSSRHLSMSTVREVFRCVERKEATYGVVPIENSTEGMVNYTLDTLVETDLKINGEVVLPIHHCLLSRASGIEQIRTVYAHPQSLAQCRGFLSHYLPHVPTVETTSNTRAVELALHEELQSAAIAGEMASDVYNVPILRRHIEDHQDNQTRFLVIGETMPDPTPQDQTSLMVSIIDRIGALSAILALIAIHNVNLTRLESRPSKKKAWDYIFFMDLAGHQKEENIQNLLKKLQDLCPYVKLLGSYPVSEEKRKSGYEPGPPPKMAGS